MTETKKTSSRRRSDVLGSTFTWLSAGALAFNLLMILGLLGLLAWQGMGYFWPRDVRAVKLQSGETWWGQFADEEVATVRGFDLAKVGKTDWQVRTVATQDPGKDPQALIKAATGPSQALAEVALPDTKLTAAALKGKAVLATLEVDLPAGRYEVVTTVDRRDGIWAQVDGVSVIDAWARKAGKNDGTAKTSLGPFLVAEARKVRIQVGYYSRGEEPQLTVQAQPLLKEHRTKLKIGNRDQFDLDFKWFLSPSDQQPDPRLQQYLPPARLQTQIVETTTPEDIAVLERVEWGNFHGRVKRILKTTDGKQTEIASGEQAWPKLLEVVDAKAELREQILDLEKGPIGDINWDDDQLRLQGRALDLPDNDLDDARKAQRRKEIDDARAALRQKGQGLAEQRRALDAQLQDTVAEFVNSKGETKVIPIADILRVIRPNEMGVGAKLGEYSWKVWELLAHEPRESNTEGGIFPAIFGTILMVFIMTVFVTPFGVLAALYLTEYSKGGPLVRMVRIAVNNLAGVPSIVFGVFGLGFFVYLIGASIDEIFYPEALPRATFGTGGILWASLTLALLTVPVVIVATEEGLQSVPQIVRAGSLALGGTKYETVSRLVLPAAAPGILTGLILAIARAAGEVAPLMILGLVKMAPELPMDHHFPFVHLERKFMHLGFHVYDVGLQSPNVEATKPLVYATALLLVVLVTAMNLVAIVIRNHLRKKYATSAV